MPFGIFDASAPAAYRARSPYYHCSECGERMTADEERCDDCEAKDRIPQDPNLECLFKLIEKKIDQYHKIIRDADSTPEMKMVARASASTARAILEDVVRIDREDR